MGLMIISGAEASAVLWILLLGALGLTFWEARELKLDSRHTAWWLLLVALTHVVGYLAMRIWSAKQKRAV